MGAAFLECKQLLGTEGLVVDLRGRLDEILEVGSQKEVSEVDEFTVVLVLNVNDTPAVLATANLLTIDNDGLFRADDSEWDETLDLVVQGTLLFIKLIIIVRVHLEVVESKFLLDALLESLALLGGKRISLGNHRHNVDDIGQLLENNNIDGLQRVAGGLNEEEAAVNAGVLDVALTLGRELLAQVGGVLVLDILDNGVPAAVIVDEVSVSRGIDNVESEAHAVFLDDVGVGLDLGGGSDGLIRLETTLGVDKVRGKDGVDQSRLAQTSLTNADNVELETALQELALDLRRDAVETDMALGENGGGGSSSHRVVIPLSLSGET